MVLDQDVIIAARQVENLHLQAEEIKRNLEVASEFLYPHVRRRVAEIITVASAQAELRHTPRWWEWDFSISISTSAQVSFINPDYEANSDCPAEDVCFVIRPEFFTMSVDELVRRGVR